MRSITENADYLLQAIEWINTQKVNNLSGLREQNIVMGISMGGLVSRYALAKRSKQTGTNSTETKAFFSMDSPHQGANVPLGLQHFLYDLGETKIVRKLGDVSEELKAFYYLINQPSTQQQLIIRVTGSDGNRVNNSFLTEGGIYRSMVDYTAPYPFYAISNGSQCAVPVMQPNSLLLFKDGAVATANWNLLFYNNKYKLSVAIHSLPTFGSSAQICKVEMKRNIRLFWGLVGTGWKVTSNKAPRFAPTNIIPWDGVPGGTKAQVPISQVTNVPNINGSNTWLGNLFRNLSYFYFVNVSSNLQLPFVQKDFTFVPITSALDVQNVTPTIFNQPFNFAVNGLNGSRANKFIAQDFLARNFFNIEHTDFTPRSSKWIYNEMENIAQPPITCVDYCTTNVSFTIFPANCAILCGDVSYKIFSAVQTGTLAGTVPVYTWSLGANNGWLYLGNNAPATISITNDNSIMLTPICGQTQSSLSVNIAANCNNYTASNTVANIAGNPYINGASIVCSATAASNYSITNIPCDATVSWSVSPVGIISLSASSGNTTTATRTSYGNATITAIISSAICGTFTKTFQVSTITRQTNSGTYTQPYNYINPTPFQTYKIFPFMAPGTPIHLEINGNPTFTSFYINNSSATVNWTLLSTNVVRIITYPNSTIVGNVYTTNECGQQVSNTFYMQMGGSGRMAVSTTSNFSISPNPASSYLQISVNKNAQEGKTFEPTFTSVNIYDKMGILKLQNNFKQGTNFATINIAGLINDTYVLKIFDGINWEEHKFLVIK